MLHILFLILKIAGIILLSILGLILLVFLIVIFTPLKYEVYGQINNSPDTAAGKIKFGYFFNILNGQFVYKDGRPRYYVALFKKKLICSKKPREDHLKEDESEEQREPEAQREPEVQRENQVTEENRVPFDGEITEEDFKYIKPEEHVVENHEPEHKEYTHNTTYEKEKKKKKKNIFDSISRKIKNMYKSICDKIKVLKEKKEIVDRFFNDKVHRKAILKAYKELKILLRKLKPYGLKGKIRYGFEEPDLTGRVLAAVSMALPYIGDGLNVEPEFNNELVYIGNINFKGKIKISYFLALCIKLAVLKSVWRTVLDAKAILDDMN